MYFEKTFIKRHEVKIELTRLNKKFKDRYRFKARAYAPLYKSLLTGSLLYGDYVYSKTEHGARVSAIQKLLQKCRPSLSKEEQKINNIRHKHGLLPIKRRVYIEVHVSNTFDFIMNNDDEIAWREIKNDYTDS